MLSVEECREFIGDSSDLSDEQIVELRDALYEFGDIVLDMYFRDKGITLDPSYTKPQ